jgi:hypothetical protein
MSAWRRCRSTARWRADRPSWPAALAHMTRPLPDGRCAGHPHNPPRRRALWSGRGGGGREPIRQRTCGGSGISPRPAQNTERGDGAGEPCVSITSTGCGATNVLWRAPRSAAQRGGRGQSAGWRANASAAARHARHMRRRHHFGSRWPARITARLGARRGAARSRGAPQRGRRAGDAIGRSSGGKARGAEVRLSAAGAPAAQSARSHRCTKRTCLDLRNDVPGRHS